jgi:signal transduction histidine kinase
VQEIVIPEDRVEAERAIPAHALETGFSTYESVRRRKDGSLVHVAITCKLVRDRRGGVEYLLLSKKDVTQLKVMRDGKLVKSRFRNLLDSLVQHRGTHRPAQGEREQLRRDRDGERCHRFRRRERKHHQFQPGGGAYIRLPGGRGHRTASHDTDAGALRRRPCRGIARYLSTGVSRLIGRATVLAGRRKDGSEFPLELSLAAWKSQGNAFFTGIIRDITDRNRFEEMLRLKNRELESANRELEAFSYSVSHDLRAPLHAIRGYADALKQSTTARLDASDRHYLDRIDSRSASMDELIDDLLSLAQISRIDLVRHAGRLERPGDGGDRGASRREPSRRSEVVVRPGMGAYGDAGLLRIVLTNLLGNAHGNSPAGARRPSSRWGSSPTTAR